MNINIQKDKPQRAQHTPGPWVDLYGNPWNDDEGNRMLVTTADKSRTIAHALNAGAIDECEANARLIAAAPELLAASEDAMQLAIDDGWEEASRIVINLRAAIAKAKGVAL